MRPRGLRPLGEDETVLNGQQVQNAIQFESDGFDFRADLVDRQPLCVVLGSERVPLSVLDDDQPTGRF